VIHHFIADYEKNGSYTGFPTLGVEWQRLENPHLRRSLGMKEGDKGVLLCQIEPLAPAYSALQKEDILVSFDGVAIANDGTVPFRQGERIGFSYLVSKKFANETATLELMQQGKRRTLQVQLQTPKRLVPVHIGEALPSYFIVAGLVFTLVSVPYLRSEYGKQYEYDAPVKVPASLPPSPP
jgi:S1-C subfamily serine protease